MEKQNQSKESKAETTEQISYRIRLGQIIGTSGMLGLPMGFGVMLGYYAGDRGLRWLPTMLEVILIICVVSLSAIAVGCLIQGLAVKETEKGTRIRRRVIACLVFAGLAIFVRLGMFWAQQPSPLTELSGADFNLAFENDLSSYDEYDSAIEDQLKSLESHTGLFDPDKPGALTADEEKYLRDTWMSIYDYSFAMDQIRFFYEDWYRFDSSRAQRGCHIRSFLLTFAAELSLYEKSTRLISLITANPNAIKFLDSPDPGGVLGENSFSRFREHLQGTRDIARVAAGRQYLLWLDKGLDGRETARALGCSRLWEKIEQELSIIDAVCAGDLVALTVSSDMQVLKRSVDHVWYPAQKGVAKWMGSTRVRRIGVCLAKPEQREKMDKYLEPGDIVLSRKNWYLSNVGLPGFWPHAILYIGSPEKFESFFDDAEIRKWLFELTGKQVSFGQYLAEKYPSRWLRYKLDKDNEPHRVIEAIKYGIVLNSLKDCFGDYMVALRPKLSKKAKAQAILEAFSHLDKPYDYHFDFATDHALVCTEVVWRCYRPAEGKDGLNLDLVDIAGRKTLPANEIARQFALEHTKTDRQMDFVYFLDASEKQGKSFASTKEEFIESYKRVKWSFSVD